MILVVLAMTSSARSLPPQSSRPLAPSTIAQPLADTIGGPSMRSAGLSGGSGFSAGAWAQPGPDQEMPSRPRPLALRKRRRVMEDAGIGMAVVTFGGPGVFSQCADNK